jgi:hypothetical protein
LHLSEFTLAGIDVQSYPSSNYDLLIFRNDEEGRSGRFLMVWSSLNDEFTWPPSVVSNPTVWALSKQSMGGATTIGSRKHSVDQWKAVTSHQQQVHGTSRDIGRALMLLGLYVQDRDRFSEARLSMLGKDAVSRTDIVEV